MPKRWSDEKLIELAASGYGDPLPFNYESACRHENGDGLADFIVIEIHEAANGDPNEAASLMEKAADQLRRAARALSSAECNLKHDKAWAVICAFNAKDWEIYSSTPSERKSLVVRELNKALLEAYEWCLEEIKKGVEVAGERPDAEALLDTALETKLEPVMSKYSAEGANDSEPRRFALTKLAKFLGIED